MQKTEEEKKKHKERYCCPNPNCKSVFSRPKIIKYYVCPTCQTLVKMDTAKGKTVKSKKHRPIEKVAESQEVEKPKQVESQAPKPIEPAQTEQPAANAEEVNQPSDSGCKHYFGYLGQRDKGEEIPNACLECPKSLDCMLYVYYKSKESVAEIKKWYPAKA